MKDDNSPVTGLLAVGQLVKNSMALVDILNVQEKAILLPEGLTPAQRDILVALRRHGPCTMSSLGREKGFSRQNARVLVKALVKREFLRLNANPEHKRAKLVDITPEGLAALQRVLHREGSVLSRLAGEISSDQAKEADATLAKIIVALNPDLHE